MNTAKWTLSILLAGCCVLPTLAQAETLYNQTAKAKQLARTKYKGTLTKKAPQGKIARKSNGKLQLKRNDVEVPSNTSQKIEQLERIVAQRVAETDAQAQAEKQTPACSCQSYQPTPEDWVRAETEVQQMLNTLDPEDITNPFDYTQEVYKRAHKCTCAPKQQEPAANPDGKTVCPCPKTQPQVAK